MALSLILAGREVADGLPMALHAPTATSLLFTPSLSPVLLAVIAAGWWYLRAVHRLPTATSSAGVGTFKAGTGTARNRAWPRRRTASFLAGLLVTAWAVGAGPQAYASSLFWVWTSQLLTLLLISPVFLVGGQPVELARLSENSSVLRFVHGPAGRFAANAFIGPALVPVITAALFFGPLPGWAVHWPPVAWVVQILVVVVGALIVLPVLDVRETRSSMVIGLAMAIGFLELLLDAIPGIVLRLQTHPASTFFDERHRHTWTPGFLRDQQNAGAILWTVAELLDLPFLVLVFFRWARADEREAAAADTVLDAERIVRASAAAAGTDAASVNPAGHDTAGHDTASHDTAGHDTASDEPWWLSDPAMRERMRRGPTQTEK